jgi:hypothetical protein
MDTGFAMKNAILCEKGLKSGVKSGGIELSTTINL